MNKVGLGKKEVIVIVGVFLLFMINASGLLYLKYFNRPLFESLPNYYQYMAIRSLLMRPYLLIASIIAICALFLGYRYTRRQNAPEEFQLMMLAMTLGAAGGFILTLLW
jgi:formate hydrogenlyase subunit 3/multisubunit Na+/H+ antiporter MnhD subunit